MAAALFKCPAPSSAQTLLVAAADLKREMEILQYREHKRFAIQGQITAVRYMANLKTAQPQTGEVKEKNEGTLFTSGRLQR